MKRLLAGSLVVLCGIALPVRADTLKNALVWAFGRVPSSNASMELSMLQALAKQQVPADSLTKKFPQGLPTAPAEALRALQATANDSLVILRRASAIRWDADEQASLQDFLENRTGVLDPKNQIGDETLMPIEMANTTRNATWEIAKGEILVFDLKTGKLLARRNLQVKSAKNLPQAKYYDLVAETAAAGLTSAGLILPQAKK